MKRITLRNMKSGWELVCCLVLGAVSMVQAEDLPAHLREAIENRFPGALIHKVEQETWEGSKVTEFELTAQDGVTYEVFVSEKGEIVKVEEED